MQKKKGCYVYEIVTADRYELPLCVADTLDELTKLTKIKKTSLCMALERRSTIAGNCKIVKVFVKDMNFNVDDYKEFCKTENLKPGYATSLEKFRQYVGAEYDCGL